MIDPKTREVVKHFVSLSGTLVNCAGGPTPWKSWITCEETLLGKDQFKNETVRTGRVHMSITVTALKFLLPLTSRLPRCL